jgi:hypothetical protein
MTEHPQVVLEKLYALLGKKAVLLPYGLGTKGPFLQGWQKTDFQQTQAKAHQTVLRAAVRRGGNIGVLLGPASFNLVTIDCDEDELLEALDKVPELRTTLRTKGARAGQIWFRAVGNYPNGQAVYKIRNSAGKDVGELRCGGSGRGAQSVVWGQHPDGMRYQFTVETPVVELDFDRIPWPAGFQYGWQEEQAPPPESESKTDPPPDNLDKRIYAYLETCDASIAGQHGDDKLYNVALKLVCGWGLSLDQALPFLRCYNERKCQPPWPEDRLKYKLSEADKRPGERGHLRNEPGSSGYEPGDETHDQQTPPRAEKEPPPKGEKKTKPEQETEPPPWEESLAAGGCTSLALFSTKIVPREPVFDDWCLVGDLGFIFAARGLGKTWLAMHLAHGAATLTNVGPWTTHKQLKTLYLDGEMPPQDIQLRDRVLGKPTENLIYLNHQLLFDRTGRIMNLASRDFQNGILTYCQTNGIGLLCLDNLSTLASGVDENKAIDWEIIQPWLLRLRRAGITVIFIHHAGRNNEMRGSSKREDPASWVLRLDDPRDIDERAGAHFISRFTKWRSKKQPKTYELKYDSVANGEVLVEVKEASPLIVFRTHVENGLDTCTMIAEEMDVSPGYVSQLATRAVKEGWLQIKNRKYVMK